MRLRKTLGEMFSNPALFGTDTSPSCGDVDHRKSAQGGLVSYTWCTPSFTVVLWRGSNCLRRMNETPLGPAAVGTVVVAAVVPGEMTPRVAIYIPTTPDPPGMRSG